MTDTSRYVTEEAVRAGEVAWPYWYATAPADTTDTTGTRAILEAAAPHIIAAAEPDIRGDERRKALLQAQQWFQALARDPRTSPAGQEWLDDVAGALSVMRNGGLPPAFHGEEASTGTSSGPHLHAEFPRGEATENPS